MSYADHTPDQWDLGSLVIQLSLEASCENAHISPLNGIKICMRLVNEGHSLHHWNSCVLSGRKQGSTHQLTTVVWTYAWVCTCEQVVYMWALVNMHSTQAFNLIWKLYCNMKLVHKWSNITGTYLLESLFVCVCVTSILFWCIICNDDYRVHNDSAAS